MDDVPHQFAGRYGVEFVGSLGEGKDGRVFRTNRLTAVKFLNYVEHYNRELRAYRLLAAGTWAEQFGELWPAVIRIRAAFHELTGLTLYDLSLNNLRFK